MAGNGTNIRVIFAGGGTGGHVYPAVAMHDALVERLGPDRVAALFVGARGGLERELLARCEKAGGRPVELKLLPGRGVRGASLANKAAAPIDLVRAVAAGIRVIRRFAPDVVVGTGGYASASMVLAAIATRTPRVLQEQNSVPGLVNRRLARFADLVLLAFTESRSAIPGGADSAVIGNPLRRLPIPDRAEAARFFGLDPARPTVLVIGGSRGAHTLNAAAADAAREMAADGVQFVVLTGAADRAHVESALDGVTGVVVRDYLDEVNMAYAAADVAVARAGASTVFELAAFAVPTVFVPYPYAADDHQRLNAESLGRVGGAVVVPDSELTGDRLAAQVGALLSDDGRRAQMRTAMAGWIGKNAALEAADRIVALVKKNGILPVKTPERALAVGEGTS